MFKEEMLELTKKMVSISSINGTEGEKNIGCFIEDYFRSIPYFKKHPDYIIVQKLKNDPLERRNIIVLLRGEKEESPKTILLHGHIDTVEIDDYGNLKEYAFNCDELMKRLDDIELSEEVTDDLHSGDYLFGRGAGDMKGGDAVFMVLLKHLSENAEAINGNIVLSLNPVEENLHTGIIEAREIFEKIRDKYNLKYLFAINNDYICPMYPNDTTRYIYTGSVGKVLPCFYIQGKETHVGQCFEGVDSSLIAAELVRKINLNPEFCDEYNGEYTLPPSVLKMKDLKAEYNVQTSFSSFVYFNYLIHNASTTNIIDKLKKSAYECLESIERVIDDRYSEFCRMTNIEYTPITYEKQVLTYDELYDMASKKYDGDLNMLIEELTDNLIEKRVDKREISLKIVEKLCITASIKKTTIVVFFAAPYCPHNTLKKEGSENYLLEQLNELISKFGIKHNEQFKICQFFPSLSDSSYLKIDDDYKSIEKLINNFPMYKKLYNVPLEKIKAFNIPAINYGCYGKDCHKWTERLYIPYSFEVLPELILDTLNYFLA